MTKANKADADDTNYLLKYQIAIQLWNGGLTQAEICKRLHLSKTTVNEMLKGVARPSSLEGRE